MASKGSDSLIDAANEYFDALVKSRFIEMFGEYLTTTESMKSLSEISEVFIDGDWIESKDQDDDGIRLIQTGNIGNGQYLDKGERARFINNDTFVRLKCKKVLKNDILISRLPDPIGRACIIPDVGEAITGVDCTIVRLKSVCNPVYFIAYTMHNRYSEQIKTFETGSTRKRISRSNLGKVFVPIPPIELQNQFADFVKQVDKSKLIFQQMVSRYDELVKSRFIEMFESNPESSGWNISSLELVCNGITDGSHNPPASGEKSNNLMISSKNIHDGMVDFEDPRYLTDEQFIIENKRTKVQKDDLLMTIVGTIGRTAIVPDFKYNVTFQRSVSVLHPKHELLNVTYLKASLDKIQPDLERQAHGSSQKGIYLNQVKAIQIKLPPIELQNHFADFVKQVDKSKSEILQGLKKLRIRRS